MGCKECPVNWRRTFCFYLKGFSSDMVLLPEKYKGDLE
ncbi:hypothetical protein KIS4809_2036 [Bacillus sp. ZZV12-4809]|nr:hypothetical protein KIS4809_2036 [Bacillus sp. ZZV12-4809]